MTDKEPRIVVEGELFSSKNSKQIIQNKSKKSGARPFFLIKSKAARDGDSIITPQLNSQKKLWDDMFDVHIGIANSNDRQVFPLRIKFFIFRKTKRAFDLNNICQSLVDMLVKAEFIPDDNMNYLIPVYGSWQLDKDRPRVEFLIDENYD